MSDKVLIIIGDATETADTLYPYEPCVIDGNLVSGRTQHDHGHYVKHWINLLITERERMGAHQEVLS